jgi:hypothetical protein
MLCSPVLVFDEIHLDGDALGNARVSVVWNPSPAWRGPMRERADEEAGGIVAGPCPHDHFFVVSHASA